MNCLTKPTENYDLEVELIEQLLFVYYDCLEYAGSHSFHRPHTVERSWPSTCMRRSMKSKNRICSYVHLQLILLVCPSMGWHKRQMKKDLKDRSSCKTRTRAANITEKQLQPEAMLTTKCWQMHGWEWTVENEGTSRIMCISLSVSPVQIPCGHKCVFPQCLWFLGGVWLDQWGVVSKCAYLAAAAARPSSTRTARHHSGELIAYVCACACVYWHCFFSEIFMEGFEPMTTSPSRRKVL